MVLISQCNDWTHGIRHERLGEHTTNAVDKEQNGGNLLKHAGR